MVKHHSAALARAKNEILAVRASARNRIERIKERSAGVVRGMTDAAEGTASAFAFGFAEGKMGKGEPVAPLGLSMHLWGAILFHGAGFVGDFMGWHHGHHLHAFANGPLFLYTGTAARGMGIGK
jgi:hypothetical protein